MLFLKLNMMTLKAKLRGIYIYMEIVYLESGLKESFSNPLRDK